MVKVKQKVLLVVAKTVEVKWKSLVDTYRTKDRSGAEGPDMSEMVQRWQFYDMMLFMQPYIARRG